MIKLKEVMDTRYLTNDYLEDVTFVLQSIRLGTPCEDNIYAYKLREAINSEIGTQPTVVDLADTVFTEKIAQYFRSTLQHYPESLQLIDSEDAERNRLVRTMSEEAVRGKEDRVPLPDYPKDITALAEWVQGLDSNVLWDAHVFNNVPCMALFIQALRPELNFVMSFRNLFEYGKVAFKSVLFYECDEFLYIPGKLDEFWDAKVNEKGMVHVVNIGDFTKQDFIMRYPCIPAQLGRQAYMDVSSSNRMREAMRTVIMDVQQHLKHKPITIETYFGEELERWK